jgi:predicted DNA-binding protein YlxM (UPF0122 family)
MSKLIESNEFGDWLMAEIAETRALSKSAHFAAALTARARLEALRTAKKSLLEFLKLQQKMFDAASAARLKEQDAQIRDPSHTPRQKIRRGRHSDPSNGSNQAQGASGV